MKIGRRNVTKLGSLALASICCGGISGCLSESTGSASSGNRKPNVILIVADDLGWTDLGCYGSKYYETPNIDRLRKNGIKFTDAYAGAANCAPARACLLTGQYTSRHGLYAVSRGDRAPREKMKMVPPPNVTNLSPDKIMIPEVMKPGGYISGFFGKWHLGQSIETGPTGQGFDRSVQWIDWICYSKRAHFDFVTIPANNEPEDKYLADYLTDKSLDFIEAQKDKPFFLYLAHYAAHSPLEAKKEYIKKYMNKKPSKYHVNPYYAAMIQSLDDSVGRIVAKVKELGLEKDTIIIFTSDNGGVGGYPFLKKGQIGPSTSNYPLRGGKGQFYEGGIRVPMIVKWDGTIKPNSTCNQPVTFVDIFATCSDLAKNTPDQIMDGESLVPLFYTSGKAKLKRKDIFWHFPGYLHRRETPCSTIRSGNYKLIEHFEDNSLELYDLDKDIGEKNNLVKIFPEKARELHEKLINWRKSTKAMMPNRFIMYYGDEPPMRRKPYNEKIEKRFFFQSKAK
jgi:arylsulfatase A-like enzyme